MSKSNHVPTLRPTPCRSPNTGSRSDHGLGARTIVTSPAYATTPSLYVFHTSSISSLVRGEKGRKCAKGGGTETSGMLCGRRRELRSDSPLLCSLRGPIHSKHSRWGSASQPQEKTGGGSRSGGYQSSYPLPSSSRRLPLITPEPAPELAADVLCDGSSTFLRLLRSVSRRLRRTPK